MQIQEKFGQETKLISEMTHQERKVSNYHSCYGKKRYIKLSHARSAMEGMKAQFCMDGISHSLNVYECKKCKRYHIGNNNKYNKNKEFK